VALPDRGRLIAVPLLNRRLQENGCLNIMARAVMADEKDPLAVPVRKMQIMAKTEMYPLRSEPIYQYRLWGGRRLADLLTTPCRATALSARRGYSATAMAIRAVLLRAPLRGRRSRS
jgi:hypothetical protein